MNLPNKLNNTEIGCVFLFWRESMISKEQIAHDLTMLYLKNRYGIDVRGDFSLVDGNGSGSISTRTLPSTAKIKYKYLPTGEKGFLGIKKTVRVEDGYEADDVIDQLIMEYHQTYNNILSRLG